MTAPWSSVRDRWFADVDAAADLVRTYHSVREDESPRYTGSRFLTWASMPPTDPDRLTSDDLVAVMLLSMRPTSQTVWTLLDGASEPISSALADVPVGVTLWDADDRQLVALDRAWAAINAVHGAGPTLTSKILARKRPLLSPVYDSVIKAALGGTFRAPLRTWLLDVANRRALEDVRTRAGLPELPLLRVFDIVVWMERTARGSLAPQDDD